MKRGKCVLCLVTVGLVAVSISGCLKLQSTQPQALFTASLVEHVVPFTASFDATLSYSPSGEIASYLWSFGDGGADEGPVADHTYSEDGVYVVRLTIISNEGASSSRTMTVQALNPPPVASFSYTPKSSMEGVDFVACSETITFSAADLCTDDGEIVSYEWYFGYRDGDNKPATAEGPTVTHEFLYAGTYSVALTVTDNDGGQTTYIEQVVVKGGPPCYTDVTGDVPWTCGSVE
jgi:PKD repeat protein